MKGVRFPQYLSAPAQVIFFDSDDFMIIVVSYIVATTIGGWIGFGLFIFVPWLYIKIKKSYPRGFLRHMLYFTGIITLAMYPLYQESEFME